MNNKFSLQDNLYRFPYHYLPSLDTDGNFTRHRSLRWGFAYLCCLLHTVSIIEKEAPAEILDIGCGDGRLLSLLGSRNESFSCTGIDPSERAIALARAINPGLRFICGRAADLDEKFIMVNCSEVLEHIPENEISSFVSAAARCVKPGGTLLVSVPSLNRPFSQKHFRHYDEQSLLEQLEPHKNNLQVVEINHVFNGNDPFYRLYLKITDNRLIFCSIGILENFMWRRVWHKLRHAGKSTAHQLVISMRKQS